MKYDSRDNGGWRHLPIGCVASLVLLLSWPKAGLAGMPAPLPLWTPENMPDALRGYSSGAEEAIVQAISFFTVCLLVCAQGVRLLWNAVGREIAWLPRLGYGRALGLTVLWGLLFIIVLTMISGARELMTPGAWQKQGWTYRLESESSLPVDRTSVRERALESIRFTLWQYAARHEGRFPDRLEDAVPSAERQVPGWPGLQFLYVSGRTVEDRGEVLVFEPSIDGDQRLALLTSGMVGTIPETALHSVDASFAVETEASR